MLRGIGFSSKSWGLTGIILWTGLKAFLHDIIPGKLHRWPLTKRSSCAHAGGSVELHSVCTFELEKLHNDLFSSAFPQSYTCLIMLVTVTQTWEIILFHFVSYHIIFSSYQSSLYLQMSVFTCNCKWPKLACDKRTGGVLPIKWGHPSFKKGGPENPKARRHTANLFFLYKSCTFSPQVTVWCSYFFAGNPHRPRPPPPSPPPAPQSSSLTSQSSLSTSHCHIYHVHLLTLLSINLSPFTWSPSVDCLGAGTPRQRWALLCAESGAQGLCKTFFVCKGLSV